MPTLYTQGPPDDWLSDPSPFRPTTIPRERKSWIRRLPKIVKKSKHHEPESSFPVADPIGSPIGLLALFGRRVAPIIRIDLQDPEDNLPDTQQEGTTGVPPATAQGDRANIPPSVVQECHANASHTVREDPADVPPVVQEDPANTPPATAGETPVNMTLTAPQQQIPLEMTPYELDWS